MSLITHARKHLCCVTASVLFVLVLICSWHGAGKLARWLNIGGVSHEFLPAYRRELLAFHGRTDVLTPDDRILFFGDSLMQGMGVAAISPLAINYGIGGETSVGLSERWSRYSSTLNARAIVLLTGINDMKLANDTDILENMGSLLERITSPVFCHALLPIAEPARINWQNRTNKRIVDFNVGLKSLCEEKGGYFIPVPPALYDSQGNLPDQFHVGDGLHPSTPANIELTKSISKALSKAGLL